MLRNEDDEYNYRLRKRGCRLLLAKDLRTKYYGRSTLVKLWDQYYQYGLWKVRVMQKHPRQMRVRQFVPPTFVAAFVILPTAALFSSSLALAMIFLVSSYVSACLIFSAIIAMRTKFSLLPLLPLAFVTLHFSYGTGMIVGAMRFWNKWGEWRSKEGVSQ